MNEVVEPIPSNQIECRFNLELIKPEILLKYNFVLRVRLQDLKTYFRATGLYGSLTSSIEKFYTDFFRARYSAIKRLDITYYYVYIYQLSLQECPQPIIWVFNPNPPRTIDVDASKYVVPAQRFPFSSIIGRRPSRFGKKKGFDYLVVWDGQWQNQTQWIPRRQISGASDLIAQFNMDNG